MVKGTGEAQRLKIPCWSYSEIENREFERAKVKIGKIRGDVRR